MGWKDFVLACTCFALLLACLWFATESTRKMTLVCVAVVAQKSGLPTALEECQ